MPRKEKEAPVETPAAETPVEAPTEAAPDLTEAPAEGQGPQLTLADVKNAVNIIDYAAQQGSFKGWDVIAQVMQVRQRLAAFVEAASPAVEGEPAAEGAATEQPTEEAANG